MRVHTAMELGAIPKRKGGQTGKLLTEEEGVQMIDNDTMATSIESLPDETTTVFAFE